MAPRKGAESLHSIAERVFMRLVMDACERIGDAHSDLYAECCRMEMRSLNEFLRCHLPPRSLDEMCRKRHQRETLSHPMILLSALIHPNMKSFKKCYWDTLIPPCFWLEHLPHLTHLVSLDLNLICTDEILEVLCQSSPRLRELNAVSRVDVNRSPFNATAFLRNVSDEGLGWIARLIDLRILHLDPPRNARTNIKVGRFITQEGIGDLVSSLRYLEELHIESCDVGATLVSNSRRPLPLKTIACHFATGSSIQKLLPLCPSVENLNITCLTENDKDEILDRIAASDISLCKINFSFFSLDRSMENLLRLKGSDLTHFSLMTNDWRITFDDILVIGRYCPRLVVFRLICQSPSLHASSSTIDFHRYGPAFGQLKSLTLGCNYFNIENTLVLFLSNVPTVTRLLVEYQTKMELDELLQRLIGDGLLANVEFLWLDYSLKVSANVIKQVIDSCQSLKHFVTDFEDKEKFFENYIRENNLDIKLDNNYQIL